MQVQAREIGGIEVQETLLADNGIPLHLNGTGIRTKFIFDIYVAQLYLEKPATTTGDVIAGRGRKRIVMHFLYKKVEKEKLVEGWNEGFSSNTDAAALGKIMSQVETFNSLFGDIHKGEQIVLDYVPESGTRVIFAGDEKGVVPGKDFNDALLRIWLGDKPVNKTLKKKLLGAK